MRKLSNVSRNLVPARMRELMLGTQIIDWCNEVEPELRKSCSDLVSQLRTMITSVQQDWLALELMGPDEGESARKDEQFRLANLLKTLVGVLDQAITSQQKLSAGGQTAVWAAYQRVTLGAMPSADTTERDAGPKRHFRSAKATEVEAQVVDSE